MIRPSNLVTFNVLLPTLTSVYFTYFSKSKTKFSLPNSDPEQLRCPLERILKFNGDKTEIITLPAFGLECLSL